MGIKEELAEKLATAIKDGDSAKMVAVAKEAFNNELELEDICDEQSEDFNTVATAIGNSGWVPGMS